MKNRFLSFLLAAISLCLLCQAPLRAQASAVWTFEFGHSTWTVPQTGNYTITAYGAVGGGYYPSEYDDGVIPGGLGAIIGATFQLSANQNLFILAGVEGMGGLASAGGGGGGTFVVDSSNNPLVVAGGGGGAGAGPGASSVIVPGDINGQTSTSGGSSYYNLYGGGSNGQGGTVGENPNDRGGAGGGGFVSGPYGDGEDAIWHQTPHYMMAEGGFSYLNGGLGGSSPNWGGGGGYGGGGAGGGPDLNDGGTETLGAGGGGGGYSGGAAGMAANGASILVNGSGGGGGSYLASSSWNQQLTVGNNNYGAVYIYLEDTPCTWTGASGNGMWTSLSVITNWNYPPLPGYLVNFSGSNQTAVDTVTNQSVGGIVFDTGASAFTISNNTITIAGNVINQSSADQTINSGLALAINAHFVSYSGNLVFGGPVSFGGNSTLLTVNGSATTAITGNISGNGSLLKRGNGTLTLSGTNTFTGNTTISGGGLAIQGGSALPDSGMVSLNSANATFTIGTSETIGSLQGMGTTAISNGQALTIAPTGNTTYSGSIVGAGTLILNGNGTLTLSGNSTFSGGTILQTGTLVLAGINAAGSGSIEQPAYAGPSLLQIGTTGTITNNMTVQNLLSTQSATLAGGIFLGTAVMNVQSGATLTLSGSLGGSDMNALTKTGNGTLALNGNIPFSGDINVNSGTLIGSSTNLSGLRQNNGTVEVLQNTNGTMSNSISGTGSLTKNGSGTLTLSGTSGYSGATTVASGTLASGNLSNSTLILQPGAAYSPGAINIIDTISVGGIILNGGDLLYNLGNATSDRINSSGAAALNGPVVFDFSNLGYSAGSFTLLTGNGVSSFNTANLSYNAAGNFSVSGNFVVSGNSLLFQTAAPAANYTWTGGAGNGNWTNSANWVTPPVAGATVHFAGANQTAVDTDANQSVGGIVFNAGASAFTISNNTITLAGNVENDSTNSQTIDSSISLAKNALFAADSGNLAFGGPISLGANFLAVTGTNSTAISGNISGTGSLLMRGAGNLTLSGTNTYTGNTSINGGNLIVQGGAALLDSGTVTLNSANATFTIGTSETIGSLQGGGTTAITANQTLTIAQAGNATYAGAITGAGSLTKNGSGALTLSGTNTYSGNTTINRGTLAVTSTGQISHSGSGFYVGGTDNSAAVNLNGGGISNFDGFIGYGNGSTGTVNMDSGNWTNGENLRVGYYGNGTLNLTGGNISNVNGVIGRNGTSNGVANVSGGTWSSSGFMTIGYNATGTLNLTGGNVLVGSGSGNITIARENGSTGTLNLGNGSRVGSLQAAQVIGGNGTALVNFNYGHSYSFASVLAGSLSVNKLGNGTTILSANNTYTGTTTISAGTLAVSGLLGGGNYSANITNNGALIIASNSNQTLGGAISGTGSLGKYGNGTLTLNGNNTYTGNTNITSGTLRVTGGNLSGNNLNFILVGTSAGQTGALEMAGGTWTSVGQAVLGYVAGSTGVANMTAGTWSVEDFFVGDGGNGTLNLTGGNLSADSQFYIGYGNGSTGVVNVDGGTLSTGNLFVGANNGNGTLNLTGGNVSSDTSLVGGNSPHATGVANVSGGTWSSQNSLQVYGTLNLTGGNVSIGNGTGNLTLGTTGSVGTLNLGNGSSVGSLLAARVVSGSGSGIVNFNNNADYAFAPILSGNLTMNKLGTGNLTLSGNSNYTGPTTISAGTLLVTGAIGSSPATIASGATLGGNGSLGGNLTLAAGSNLAFNPATSLAVNGSSVSFGNFSLSNLTGFNGSSSSLGGFTVLGGTAKLNTENLNNYGPANSETFGSNEVFFFTKPNGSNLKLAVVEAIQDLYWVGNNGTSWGSENWSTNSSATTGNATLNLGATLDLHFASTGANATNTANTTLSANTTVRHLTVSSGGNVGIGGTGVTLTLNSTQGPSLHLTGSASNVNISVPVIVAGGGIQIDEGNLEVTSVSGSAVEVGIAAGASFAYNTNSTLSFNGTIVGGGSFAKRGNGTLTLNGSNDYTGGTTISAGTLAGNAESLQGNIANSGAVLFDQSANGTYSGILSGAGSLTKQGTGTLTLTGNNTYTGATAISAGTLAFNSAYTQTLPGIVSGAGSLLKAGTGTLALTGNNSFTGGTALAGGTVQALHAKALGNGALTLSSGTLALGNATTTNLALTGLTDLTWSSSNAVVSLANGGNISASGNFTNGGNSGNRTFDFGSGKYLQRGNNTLVSFGNTTFSNSDFLASFSANMSIDGSFQIVGNTLVYTLNNGTASGNIIDNWAGPDTPDWVDFSVNGSSGTVYSEVPDGESENTIDGLVFSNSGNLVIQPNTALNVTGGILNVVNGSSLVSGGTLATPGDFNKTGSGELDVQSTLSVNGTASINAGLLSVNGNLIANSVSVNSGATLGGSGTIFAPVTVSGTLAPGNSPGTLSVASLALTPTAVSDIEIESLANFDRLLVSGAATVDGTLNVIPYNGNPLDYGQQYAFLTAGGGITGEFDTINAPATFRGRFLNLGTTGVLLIAPDTYTRVAVTPNQREVATALDSFIPASSGDRETVSIALDLQTAEQYPYAFEQIMPGFYESLANIAIEQTYNQAQLLTQRMGSVRLGATGFQAIGMSQPIKYDKDGKSAADAKTASPIVESAIDTNWNSWVIANGEFSISRGLSGVPNYNNNAGGFLVGADYRLSENFAAGLFAGYEYSYAKYNGGSSTRGNSALFGLYGSYTHEDGYYADAIVSGGYTGFQTRRSIEFSTIDRTARANPNSGQFSAALNLGKDFEIGRFTLGPIIGAQYTYAGIGGFTESGAESLDLALGQQNANSLRTNLGARLAYNWEVGSNITLIPEIRGFWMHEFLNNPRNINSSLDGGNGASFDYETSAPYRNSIFGGVGISAKFADRWNASVFYNVNFGAENYTNNIISTSLGFAF